MWLPTAPVLPFHDSILGMNLHTSGPFPVRIECTPLPEEKKFQSNYKPIKYNMDKKWRELIRNIPLTRKMPCPSFDHYEEWGL